MKRSARGDNRPIGVFDSGLGGLTVFKALQARLPREHLVYFGDTAHFPYGNKSKEAVTGFSKAIGRFLEGRGIKLLVVACNTASALALGELKKSLRVPVIGVIEPGIRAASSAGVRSVGVIATEATIASGAYQKAIHDSGRGPKVLAAACPLFVPLVEEGWWSDAVTREVAKRYLRPLKKGRVEALFLGCTHYPLLKGILRDEMGSRVRLIDSAEETARETQRLLEDAGLARRSGRGSYRFYASDGPQRFLRLARRLLGVGVRSVEVRRLDA